MYSVPVKDGALVQLHGHGAALGQLNPGIARGKNRGGEEGKAAAVDPGHEGTVSLPQPWWGQRPARWDFWGRGWQEPPCLSKGTWKSYSSPGV